MLAYVRDFLFLHSKQLKVFIPVFFENLQFSPSHFILFLQKKNSISLFPIPQFQAGPRGTEHTKFFYGLIKYILIHVKSYLYREFSTIHNLEQRKQWNSFKDSKWKMLLHTVIFPVHAMN
jgi:hypothetical protein